jgi:hypothetical protein
MKGNPYWVLVDEGESRDDEKHEATISDNDPSNFAVITFGAITFLPCDWTVGDYRAVLVIPVNDLLGEFYSKSFLSAFANVSPPVVTLSIPSSVLVIVIDFVERGVWANPHILPNYGIFTIPGICSNLFGLGKYLGFSVDNIEEGYPLDCNDDMRWDNEPDDDYDDMSWLHDPSQHDLPYGANSDEDEERYYEKMEENAIRKLPHTKLPNGMY